MLGRRVLRARTLPGIAQEIYALLTVYQAIRIAIADATSTVPGADPDRAGFSIALHTVRDQVVQAAGVIAGTTIDLVGAIGRAVLNNLMPVRRLRLGPRAVNRPMSATPTRGGEHFKGPTGTTGPSPADPSNRRAAIASLGMDALPGGTQPGWPVPR
ncbi:hypothetical protein ACQPXS_40945 [Streptomyces sp. CA-142005]|uniref:hypothetical protein n=1 Tax=Streptomyces sp. CA-142005 TaxID=3240052 RepID=UPI003D8CA122